MAQYNLLGGVNPINPEYEQQQAMLGKGTNWAEYDLRKQQLKEQKKANKMNTIMNGINTAFKAYDAYQQSKEFDLRKESQDLINTEREIDIQSKRIDLNTKQEEAIEDKEYLDGLMSLLETGRHKEAGAWMLSHRRAAQRNADTTYSGINSIDFALGNNTGKTLLTQLLPETAEKIRQFDVEQSNANYRAQLSYQGQQLSAASRIQAANINRAGKIDAERIKSYGNIISAAMGNGGSLSGIVNPEMASETKRIDDSLAKSQTMLKDNSVFKAFAADNNLPLTGEARNFFTTLDNKYDEELLNTRDLEDYFNELWPQQDRPFGAGLQTLLSQGVARVAKKTPSGEPVLDPKTQEQVYENGRELLDTERSTLQAYLSDERYAGAVLYRDKNTGEVKGIVPLKEDQLNTYSNTKLDRNILNNRRLQDIRMTNEAGQRLAALGATLGGNVPPQMQEMLGVANNMLQVKQQQLAQQGVGKYYKRGIQYQTDAEGNIEYDANGQPIGIRTSNLFSVGNVNPMAQLYGKGYAVDNDSNSEIAAKTNLINTTLEGIRSAETPEEQEKYIESYKQRSLLNQPIKQLQVIKNPDFINWATKNIPAIKDTDIVDTVFNGMNGTEFTQYLNSLSPREREVLSNAIDGFVTDLLLQQANAKQEHSFGKVNEYPVQDASYQTNQYKMFKQGVDKFISRSLASIDKGNTKLIDAKIFTSGFWEGGKRTDNPFMEVEHYQNLTNEFLKDFAENFNGVVADKDKLTFDNSENMSGPYMKGFDINRGFGNPNKLHLVTLSDKQKTSKLMNKGVRERFNQAIEQVQYLMLKYKNNPTMLQIIKKAAEAATESAFGRAREATPPLYETNKLLGASSNKNRRY